MPNSGKWLSSLRHKFPWPLAPSQVARVVDDIFAGEPSERRAANRELESIEPLPGKEFIIQRTNTIVLGGLRECPRAQTSHTGPTYTVKCTLTVPCWKVTDNDSD